MNNESLTVWRILWRPLSTFPPICCWLRHVSPPRPRVWAAWCRAGEARGCWGCQGARGTCHCTCSRPCHAANHSVAVSVSWPASPSSLVSCAPCSPVSWPPAPEPPELSWTPGSSWLSLNVTDCACSVSACWLGKCLHNTEHSPRSHQCSHQPHWPGRPGVLADINRLPLSQPGRADSLHWHWALIGQRRQTRAVIGGEDSSLPISWLGCEERASEELIMDRGDGDCQMTSCEDNHCLQWMSPSSRRTPLTGSVPGHTNKSVSGQAGKLRDLSGARVSAWLIRIMPPVATSSWYSARVSSTSFSLSLAPIMSAGTSITITTKRHWMLTMRAAWLADEVA